MNKSLLIFFFVLSSLISGPVLAGSCDINFRKVYFDRTAELKMAKLSHQKVDELLLRIENEMLFDKEKIEALEHISDALSGYHRKKMKVIEDVAADLRSGIPEEMIPIYKKQFASDAIREIVPYNNRMINSLKPILEKKGIPVKIETRVLLEEVKVNYLVLDVSGPSTYESVRKIQAYQKRFGTKLVTFDFFQNIQSGSGGFSIATQKRIDLGMSGIKSIANDDLITMVGKHEFHHGAFANMRAQGKKSIYHPSYIATQRANLSQVDNHYKRYMSAEELYNWANNPWWASSRLRDPSKYTMAEIFDDIDTINFYVKGTTKIAKQTDEVSRNFVKYLDHAQEELQKGKTVYFELLNSQNAMSGSVDDLYSIAFYKEDGVILLHYIDDDLLPLAKKIKGNQLKFVEEFDKKASALTNPTQLEKLQEEYLEKSIKGVEGEISKLLGIVKKDQELLSKVARVVEQENVKLEGKMAKLIEEVKIAYKLSPDFYKSEHWKIRFESMTNDFRHFGNLVKENYKGFAGLSK